MSIDQAFNQTNECIYRRKKYDIDATLKEKLDWLKQACCR